MVSEVKGTIANLPAASVVESRSLRAAARQKLRFENVLIVGATSSLARAFATHLAKRGARLILAARNLDEAQRLAQDLKVRYGAETTALRFVAEDYKGHLEFFEAALAKMGTIDGVFIAVGELGEQKACQVDFEQARRVIESNFTGVASLLTPVANYFEARRSGFIVAIGSVAGDRGRQSNYVYGSAKAALAAYMQGLRNRLASACVQVLTVKPGFLDTKMTFGKVAGGPLMADVDSVAKEIIRAIDAKQNVVYVPWFWAHIMQIIRMIPERLFMRLKL
jgi:short-subunit dehydrogenase